MQEETNEKTIALYIKTGKLTAQQLQKAMKALLAQMKKQHDKQKIPHGKQTLKQLMILSILVYTFFSRMFDLMLPPVAKHSIVVA